MMDRKTAEKSLANAEPGEFIIRPTTHGMDGEFSISVKFRNKGDISHFKLSRDQGKMTWSIWGEKFKSLQEFVIKYQTKALENKQKEKVTLDKDAFTGVVIADESDYLDTYYYNEGLYEDPTYEDTCAASDKEEDNEDQEILGPAICRRDFEENEEGTVSVKRGDRLTVQYKAEGGWVYIKKDKGGEEGFVPEENIKFVS